MQWSWFTTLLGALKITLELTAIVTAVGIVWSLVVAAATFSEVKAVARLARFYIDIMRSIPLLPALVSVNYGLGAELVRWNISTFWMVFFILVLIESGYTAEVYRGIFRAMPAGQWEAARSLGLSWTQIIIRVVIPVSVPALIPVSVNSFVFTLKDTSLASIVALPEVTLAATTLVSETFEPLKVYILLAVVYLGVSLPVMGLAWLLQRFTGDRVSWRRPRVPLRSAVVAGGPAMQPSLLAQRGEEN
ncbi:amino acid ABC transporter permease [Jatrophihabitans sp. DSM 45814]